MTRIAFLILILIAGVRLNAAPGPDSARHDGLAARASAVADSGASISGTLKDERGNPIANASVECTAGGVNVGRGFTDFDGNYAIRPLSAGSTTLTFKFQGKSLEILDIVLANGVFRKINGTLWTAPDYILDSSKGRYRRNGYWGCNPYKFPEFDYPGGRATHSGHMLW